MAGLNVHSYLPGRNRTLARCHMRQTGGGVGLVQNDELDAPEQLLTPSEVAALFRVNPKTVTRWARAGKLTAIRTLGGHRRFRVSEIRRCLEEMSTEEV